MERKRKKGEVVFRNNILLNSFVVYYYLSFFPSLHIQNRKHYKERVSYFPGACRKQADTTEATRGVSPTQKEHAQKKKKTVERVKLPPFLSFVLAAAYFYPRGNTARTLIYKRQSA
ncbi:unnamed protein product [Ixodes persulcatus]